MVSVQTVRQVILDSVLCWASARIWSASGQNIGYVDDFVGLFRRYSLGTVLPLEVEGVFNRKVSGEHLRMGPRKIVTLNANRSVGAFLGAVVAEVFPRRTAAIVLLSSTDSGDFPTLRQLGRLL